MIPMIDAAELRRKLDAETRALAAIKELVDAVEQHIIAANKGRPILTARQVHEQKLTEIIRDYWFCNM
jgi:hypothetical protein